MFRRMVVGVLAVVALVILAGSPSLSQVSPSPQPEAGVRGTGAIQTSDTSVGVLDINVARSGNILFGGFRFQESSADSLVNPGNIVYSQAVTGLTIAPKPGSPVSVLTATVDAVGFWNGMRSNLQVYVEDLGSGKDFIRVVARPEFLDIIYIREGYLFKGDILVYETQPVPNALAKGYGVIAVGTNLGKFEFVAERMGDVVKGKLYYVEYNPRVISPVARPKVQIYIPQVTVLTVQDNTATLAGKGTFNGRPAYVEVRAIDWSPAYRRPDEFYITARPLSSSLQNFYYNAGGPLLPQYPGEIVVRIGNAN
jgi:hypothetical protein